MHMFSLLVFQPGRRQDFWFGNLMACRALTYEIRWRLEQVYMFPCKLFPRRQTKLRLNGLGLMFGILEQL